MSCNLWERVAGTAGYNFVPITLAFASRSSRRAAECTEQGFAMPQALDTKPTITVRLQLVPDGVCVSGREGTDAALRIHEELRGGRHILVS